MGMTFRKNFDVRALADEGRKRRKFALERAMEEAAGEIVQRTQSGKDVNGSGFKAYSKEYAKTKSKSGRSSKPDLTFSGRMLTSITSKVEETSTGIVGRIFFPSSQSVKARANQAIRRFFGLSKKQIDKLTDALRQLK